MPLVMLRPFPYLLVLSLCVSTFAQENGGSAVALEEAASEGESERPETTPYDAEGEAEEKGIIPPGAEVSVSTTGPLTPVSAYFEKNDHEAGLENLARADTLWKKG